MGFGLKGKRNITDKVFDKGVDGSKIFNMEEGVKMMKGKKTKGLFDISENTTNLNLDGTRG